MNTDPPFKLPDGSLFSIKISESMEIRNMLRSGLFDAQGKNSDTIPLFVSWPSWLEDGIVCMYAKDLHSFLRKTIRDTASSFSRLIEQPDGVSLDEDSTGEPKEPDIDKARKAARVILEQPLGRQLAASEAIAADTVDIEPDTKDGGE